MSWERGRSDIERLLADGELERVTPSDEVTARLLADGEAHVRLAGKGVTDDPAGALQLSYDAARKASAALLAVQGLRATTTSRSSTRSGRQFNDRGGMEVFGRLGRLRRRRNATEYPDPDSPTVTVDEAERALETARSTVDAATEQVA
jgi:hypothetical protein